MAKITITVPKPTEAQRARRELGPIRVVIDPWTFDYYNQADHWAQFALVWSIVGFNEAIRVASV